MTDKKRLIIGITGASGAIIGITLLKELKKFKEWESHLIISDGGAETIKHETDYKIDEVCNIADYVYDNKSIGSFISSGSYKTEGMVIVPCSMKTLGGICSGYSDNLLLRVADVTLKERRKLVLVTREMPLNEIHVRNMYDATKYGAIIMPPVMSFYNKPETIEDMIIHVCGKITDVFGIDMEGYKRWGY